MFRMSREEDFPQRPRNPFVPLYPAPESTLSTPFNITIIILNAPELKEKRRLEELMAYCLALASFFSRVMPQPVQANEVDDFWAKLDKVWAEKMGNDSESDPSYQPLESSSSSSDLTTSSDASTTSSESEETESEDELSMDLSSEEDEELEEEDADEFARALGRMYDSQIDSTSKAKNVFSYDSSILKDATKNLNLLFGRNLERRQKAQVERGEKEEVRFVRAMA